MNKPLICCVLFGLLLSLAGNVPAQDKKGPEVAALEKKLVGTWYGPACGGDFMFKADGTYTAEKFTPGQNHLAGTWSIRWDALPPTLVMVCESTDFKTRSPDRDEYLYLGKPLATKLIELSDDVLIYRSPDGKSDLRFSRDRMEGGSVKRVE